MLNFNPDETVRLITEDVRTPNAGLVESADRPWAWPAAEGAPPSPLRTENERRGKIRINDSALRRNQRSIERHINDDHYVRSISPGAMVIEGTAAHATVNFRWGVLSLPNDGTISAGLFAFDRPSEWIDGKVKVTLLYSSPVASGLNFRVLLQFGVSKDGSVMTGTSLPLSSTDLLPGPGVAYTRMSYSIYSTGNVTREFDLLNVTVRRTSGHADDLNANDFHVYGIRVEHVSAVREAT